MVYKQLQLDNVASPHDSVSTKQKRRKRRLASLSRKEKRRVVKQVRKARRIAHSTKQPLADLYSKIRKARGKKVDFDQLVRSENRQPSGGQCSVRKFTLEHKERGGSDDEESLENKCNIKQERKETSRKARHLSNLMKDEMEIKKYAKRLKLNKRKNKTLPKSFDEDGLSYLLDICNGAKRLEIENPEEEEEILNDNFEQFGDERFENVDVTPAELPASRKCPKRRFIEQSNNDLNSCKKKRVRFLLNEKSQSPQTAKASGINDEEIDEVDTEAEESYQDDLQETLTEDIYGRLRDRKGSIVKQTDKSPSQALNMCDDGKTTETLARNFRSIVNRLSEANIQMSAGKILKLYGKYSRTSVKSCLTIALFNSLIKSEKVPDRLILEHCLLLAFLHNKLPAELSIHRFKLASLVSAHERSLLMQRCISLHSKENTSSCIINDANSNDVFLNYGVGYHLRKDAPLELKSLIESINARAASIDKNSIMNESRMKFMLDTLQSVKNNNFLKIAHCDLELNDHFLKLIRGCFAGKQLEPPLPMNLKDLWSAQVNGRWWVVGSAVTVARPSTSQKPLNVGPNSESLSDEIHSHSRDHRLDFNEELLRLAKKNHMNTDLRRNIFCVVISSEDYLDAFEKLSRLSLKGQQEREIIHIAVSCCLKEKTYNPYYAYLLQRFCQNHKRFEVIFLDLIKSLFFNDSNPSSTMIHVNHEKIKLTTQFAVWDKIKLLNELPDFSLRNLGLCIGHLLSGKTLPLSALKVLDFGALSKRAQRFCSFLFEKFLCEVNEGNLRNIFSNCLSEREKQKHEALVESIMTFMKYFLMKDSRLIELKEVYKIVKKRIEVLENFLYYHVGSSLL